MPPFRSAFLVLAASAALGGCIGGSSGTSPVGATSQPVELVFCRARVGQTSSNSEIALRSAQNVGNRRVGDRSGRELGVRLHPDRNRVVFARERSGGDETSREILVSSLDGNVRELRLTQNDDVDDEPCWSPDGSSILFSTSRDGGRRLYLCAADGSDQRPFLSATSGIEDGQPDWHPGSGRVVFSRRDGGGPRRLWLLNGDGSGLTPLTTAASGLGDHEPTFSPDGNRVLFVRRDGADRARLLTVEVGGGAVATLFDPAGDVRLPRWSPGAERIFCGLAQPDLGRAGMRLSVVPATGGEALLVQPGEQWLLDGLDVLPTMAAPRAAAAPVELDVDEAEIQVATGFPASGNRTLLRDADGVGLVLASSTFENDEVAAINCRWTLPVEDALEVLSMHVEIRARISRSDANSVLRSSLYDPGEERFDTVVERPDPGTGWRTMSFATQSLAHVSRQRQVRFTVVGQMSPGGRGELEVDQVRLRVVTVERQPTAPAVR